MNTPTTTDRLNDLFAYLDGLTERASIDTLQSLLAELEIRVDDVRDFVRFSEDRYLRNLMRDGPWYHVLILCWRSGQRSPIHNHAGSTCGFRILRGTATETVFDFTPSGLIHPVSSATLPPGTVRASQDADIHQVSNLQAAGTDLITLHIYSPPLLRMDTYSLTDRTVGEFRPMIVEHSLGSGI